MQIVSVQKAKDSFSALLQAVEEGDEVIITRHGKKVARIVHEPDADPTEADRARIRNGALEQLRAYQARLKADADYKPGDWKSFRDEGRK